jgi:hypothetical protein
VVSLVVVATLSLTLWRPSIEMAANTAEEDGIVAEFAVMLGSANGDAIEARLRSFNHFPPEDNAVHALAEGLIACRTASLDDTERRRLAEQLYAITTETDALPNLLPGALSAIRRSMITAHCPPLAIESVVSAARNVARRDPRPRRDWW